MREIPQLSGRGFKHLRRITKPTKPASDEEIHDMGRRLLTLCGLLAENGEDQEPECELTEQEIAALQIIANRAETVEGVPSARELSRALNYKSSRSGHQLLRRLMEKGALRRNGRQLEVVLKLEGKFEVKKEGLILEPEVFHDRRHDEALLLQGASRK